jgi:hypothetical protein
VFDVDLVEVVNLVLSRRWQEECGMYPESRDLRWRMPFQERYLVRDVCWLRPGFVLDDIHD